jgi:rSAM/selenodomain-associated transferase 2
LQQRSSWRVFATPSNLGLIKFYDTEAQRIGYSMHQGPGIELSIVIPVLNEAGSLPALFAMLARQQALSFELVLVDGGSTDGSAQQVEALAGEALFPCRIVRCGKGRGRQLNAGVREAAAETLLFLHADSEFTDPLALRTAVDGLNEAIMARKNVRAAGRFALRFRREGSRPSFGYYFYECKARLDRPECTHGDQGFLLRRAFFDTVGPFAESLSLLEDTRLAEKIRQEGEWLLFPAEIVTSARRFEAEGLYERQLLNALIMNFAAIGWDEFFQAAPDVYRRQDRTRRLRLLPFMNLIRGIIRQLPWRRRFELWYRTGCYVRPNAWQPVFALDVRRNFRSGLPPGEGGTPLFDRFERWYEPLTDHPPGRLAAAVLVWIWFHLTFLRRLFCERSKSPGAGPRASLTKGD